MYFRCTGNYGLAYPHDLGGEVARSSAFVDFVRAKCAGTSHRVEEHIQQQDVWER